MTVVAAVTEGATVDELADYDLVCAPPFDITWRPVLTAAEVLGGRL